MGDIAHSEHVEDHAGGVEEAARDLEELGLSPSAARVLVTLLKVGSATSVELARLSHVPRASTYTVLEDLERSDLVERLPGESPTVWAGLGRDELLDRLTAAEEERHAQQRQRVESLGEVLSTAFPDATADPSTRMRLIRSPAQVKRASDMLFDETGDELLVFSRPPYLNAPNRPLRQVMSLLARGVPARSLNRSRDVDDPGSRTFRADIHAYAEAGMEVRVVPDLPAKMLIFDRRRVLLALLALDGQGSYPDVLLIDDPGCAEIMRDAFEHRWYAAPALPTKPARRPAKRA